MAGPQRAPVDAALGGYTPFFAVFFVVVAASVGFAAADLIYGARSTQDRALKRHVRLPWWALAALLPSVLVSLISTDIANLVSEGEMA